AQVAVTVLAVVRTRAVPNSPDPLQTYPKVLASAGSAPGGRFVDQKDVPDFPYRLARRKPVWWECVPLMPDASPGLPEPRSSARHRCHIAHPDSWTSLYR